MDSTQIYYTALIDELYQAGLDKDQIVAAITKTAPKTLTAALHQVVNIKYAQFFTENQYPEPDSAYNMSENDSSYFQQLKGITQKQPSKDGKPDQDWMTEPNDQVINLITETASLADKRGLVRQAAILDEILVSFLG